MEELDPSPKRKDRLRDWAKPALFTAILYAGLAGGYFFYKKSAKPTIMPTNPVSTNLSQPNVTTSADVVNDDIGTQDDGQQKTDVSITKTVVNAMPIAEQANRTQATNVRIFTTTPTPTDNNIKPVQPPNPPIDSPASSPTLQAEQAPEFANDAAQNHPKNSKESAALTRAEAEAEAQNELLREAINKVRTLNDNKIAKSYHNATESSVAPHPPIIQDESQRVQKEENPIPSPPKIEKQTNKVVIEQESQIQAENGEQATE